MGIRDAIGDFVDSITSGRGQDRSRGKQAGYGGRSNKSVGTSSLRPQLRPDDFAKQVARSQQDSGGSDGNGSEAYKKMMAAPEDYNDPQNPVDLSSVPYFSGPSVRKYDPNQGIFDFLKNVMFDSKKDALTDLRLGIGSLTGGGELPGFKNALESMGFAGLPEKAYETAFKNYTDRTDKTEAAMKGQETDDYSPLMDSFDPCPEGYQTDPVTGMCVPVMGAEPEPIPFPDLLGGGGGMTSPVLPLMDYTQPIDYTAPRISPPVPQGIAGIPRTPIIG